MTLRDAEIDTLEELEADFEAAATDSRFAPKRKSSLMLNALKHMQGVVRRSANTQNPNATDLAEFVQDFITRRDLGAKWADSAFLPSRPDLHQTIMREFTRASINLTLYEGHAHNFTLEQTSTLS